MNRSYLSALVGRAIGELDRAQASEISASTVANRVIRAHPAMEGERDRVHQIAAEKLA